MKKLFLVLISALTLLSACNLIPERPGSGEAVSAEEKKLADNNYNLSRDEQFNAVVFGYMKLSEVADTNNISIQHLKGMMGIPDYIRTDYKIEQIGKNYKFNANDVKAKINDYKNKQIAKKKKSTKSNK